MSKTSRSTVLGRFASLAGTIGCGVWLFMFLMGVAWPLLPVFIGAFAGIAVLVLFCWGGSRLLGHLFLGHDPAYQEWCRRSDPWFDTLPPPFRAPETQQAPYLCLRCRGGMWSHNGICPSCGYGRNEMVCSCGLEVVQPHTNAFEMTGVICPNCHNILRR